MAKRRNKDKESIFVTNEYLEKCGIQRQVVRASIEKGKIKPVGYLVSQKVVHKMIKNDEKSEEGLIKNPFLFYQRDADYLILTYWVINYKRYLKSIYQVWQKLAKQDEYKTLPKKEHQGLLFGMLEGNEKRDLLPPYIIEFNNIADKYVDRKNQKGIKDDDPFYLQYCKDYIEGISQRNLRFVNAGLTIEKFIARENQNRFIGRKHMDAMREYLIIRWFKEGRVLEIEKMLNELEQRKNKAPGEYESEKFYKIARTCYGKQKTKKG